MTTSDSIAAANAIAKRQKKEKENALICLCPKCEAQRREDERK